MSKMKIVWMCTFDIKYIKNYKVKFVNNYDPQITAPWINLLIDNFKQNSNIELHILASYYKVKKDYHFCEDGVFYHLFSQKLPLLDKTSPVIFKKLTKYYFLRKKVNKSIQEIKPDIIHIHGTDIDLAEINSHSKIPVLLSPTTINIHAYEYYQNKFYKIQTKRERRIFKKIKHFGIRANFMKKIVHNYNPNAKFHWHCYPTAIPAAKEENYPDKDADIVFAARLNKNKGIEDLLYAMPSLKNYSPVIRLKIVGDTGSKEYERYIHDLVFKLGIENNVRFLGRMNTQEDLFVEIAKSKVYVLPTYFDIIPGSIVETMNIGVPVITYPVGGIPDLNIGDERVFFAQKGNIEDLSSKIIEILNEYPAEVVKKARYFVETNYSNEKAVSDLIDVYKNILRKEYV